VEPVTICCEVCNCTVQQNTSIGRVRVRLQLRFARVRIGPLCTESLPKINVLMRLILVSGGACICVCNWMLFGLCVYLCQESDPTEAKVADTR